MLLSQDMLLCNCKAHKCLAALEDNYFYAELRKHAGSDSTLGEQQKMLQEHFDF